MHLTFRVHKHIIVTQNCRAMVLVMMVFGDWWLSYLQGTPQDVLLVLVPCYIAPLVDPEDIKDTTFFT